jgi:hypothetical protein
LKLTPFFKEASASSWKVKLRRFNYLSCSSYFSSKAVRNSLYECITETLKKSKSVVVLIVITEKKMPSKQKTVTLEQKKTKSEILQIRIPTEEYEAIQQLAEVSSTTISDFCRQAIRLGVHAEQLAVIFDVAVERRKIDREESRKNFNLTTQCALILHELGEKAGLDLSAVREQAAAYTAEHFLDGDSLEQALLEAAEPGVAQ